MTRSPAAPGAGQILTGPLFDEPMRVETVAAAGPDGWSLGLVGTRSERFRKVALGADDLAGLTVRDGWASPGSSTRISGCRSRASTRCRTSWRRSTTTC